MRIKQRRRRRKGGRKKGERGEKRDQQMTEIRYASSDVFVFPSETETLGLVAIEAMAGGLPVVGVAARGTTLFSFFPSPQSHFSLPPSLPPLIPLLCINSNVL